MSLPIEESALAAQSKAEHEYGERLMDAAMRQAIEEGRESVTAEDIENAEFWGFGNVRPPVMLPTSDGYYLSKGGKLLRCICAEKYGAKVSEG
jgi:hypothetical protein